MSDDESTAPLLGPSSDNPGREGYTDYVTVIEMDDLADHSISTSKRDTTTPFPLPDEKLYHVFISHSHEDIQTATQIVEYLESLGLKCCWHKRDFTLGVSVLENIGESMSNSVLMVPIVSRGFLRSNYCKHELNLLLHENIRKHLNNVIPVVLCPMGMIPNEIKMLTCIEAAEENSMKRLFDCAVNIMGNDSTNAPTPLGYNEHLFQQADADKSCCLGGCTGMLYRNLGRMQHFTPHKINNFIHGLYVSDNIYPANLSVICLHIFVILVVFLVVFMFFGLVLILFYPFANGVTGARTVLITNNWYSKDESSWRAACISKHLNITRNDSLHWPPWFYFHHSIPGVYCTNTTGLTMCSSVTTAQSCEFLYGYENYFQFYLDESMYAHFINWAVFGVVYPVASLVMWLIACIIIYCHCIGYSKSYQRISQFQQNKDQTLAQLMGNQIHLIQRCITKITTFDPHGNWAHQTWYSMTQKEKQFLVETEVSHMRNCYCGNRSRLLKIIGKLRKTKEPKYDLCIWFLPEYLQRYYKTNLNTPGTKVPDWHSLVYLKALPSPDQFLHQPDVMCFCQFVKMKLKDINKWKLCSRSPVLWSDDEV